MPPCPGINEEKSLMPSFLLIELSKRSPTVPDIAKTNPISSPSLN
jgi:hypothetical protein